MTTIEQHHLTDAHGNPAGGTTTGRGFEITWQDGPLLLDRPNGAFAEDVIEAIIGRIEYYQSSKFHSLHNAVALGHLHAAAEALAERTRELLDHGVEGAHQP